MPVYDCTPSGGSSTSASVSSFNGRTGAVIPQAGDYTATQVGAVAAAMAGQPNGVAELDGNGLVPASQLPGFVDDVVDAYIVGSTPYAADWLSLSSGGAALTPAASTIYLIVSAGEYQNRQYRWSGTQYAIISESLALGETADTAYRGDRGRTAYDHSQITDGNPHGTTGQDIPVSPGIEENIATALDNKAPAGFGPGQTTPQVTDNIDTIDKTGLYAIRNTDTTQGTFPVAGNAMLLHMAYGATYAYQYYYLLGATSGAIYRGCIAIRTIEAGDIGPWEYVNPPLQIGVEYRTVERYLGKPVYAKAISLGALPNNSQKLVNHGVENMDYCLSLTGTVDNYNILGFNGVESIFCGITAISVTTNSDQTSREGIAVIHYTKSTD